MISGSRPTLSLGATADDDRCGAPSIGCWRAVKLVRPEVLGGSTPGRRAELQARFEREAQATSSLRSHAIGDADGVLARAHVR